MPRLTLPDGTHPELPEGEPVGSVLRPDAIVVRVDGELRDLSFVPSGDVSVEPVESPVGCGKLVTPPGRTRAPRHRDDRDSEPKRHPTPADATGGRVEQGGARASAR